MRIGSRLLSALILAVVTAGVAIAAAAALSWRDEDLLFLASMSGFAALAEAADFGPFKHTRVSISIAFVFAAGAVSGLPGAVLVGCAAVAADSAVHPKAWYKTAFNFGVVVSTGAVFVAVLGAFSWTHDSGDWFARIGPAMAGAAAAFAVNSISITTAVALDNRISFRSIWVENFGWVLPHYVFFGVLSVLMALAYDRWDFVGLTLLLVPVGAAWVLMKQSTEGARQSHPAAANPAP